MYIIAKNSYRNIIFIISYPYIKPKLWVGFSWFIFYCITDTYVEFQASQQCWNYCSNWCCAVRPPVGYEVNHMVRDTWVTCNWTQVILLPSQGVHDFYQVIDSRPGPGAIVTTVAYFCAAIQDLLNALLTAVFFRCGPCTCPMSESLSSLPLSLLWALGSHFSFSILRDFTKQRDAQKSDLNGDMDSSLFPLSFCICWLFSPLVLNFIRICFCVKTTSLTWKIWNIKQYDIMNMPWNIISDMTELI